MSVYITVRHKKLTMFLSSKENVLIVDLKRKISCIIHNSIENQQFIYKGKILDDKKTLLDYGLSAAVGTTLNRIEIGLILKTENGEFGTLEITPYSRPITVNTAVQNHGGDLQKHHK